jgi:glycosyltransferase involved in cell wall biosynthesis
MKILHLISSGGMYGAENMLLNLCRSLPQLDCEIVVGIFQNKQNPHPEVAEKLRAGGLVVEIIPCAGQVDPAALWRIRQLIRKSKVDLVHSHGYKGDVYAFLATRFASVPLIATAHNWTGKTELPPLYKKLDLLALRRFSCVVAVSEGVAQILRDSGVAQQKIVHVPNGIDLAPFDVAVPTIESELGGASGPAVGLIGRLVPEKGCDHFLRAASEVLPRFPDARFILVGDGPQRPSLEQLARDLNIDRNVIFLGHRGEMPGVYASLDICILPSFEEGMPMTILEAMAAGKPVIATPVGEVPKIVDPQVDGLLVSPGNVSELSAAMTRLLGDVALGRRMGENGRQKARRSFSANAMAQAYLALYHRVLCDEQSQTASSFQRA